MAADENELDRLIDAVLDGDAIEWDVIESSASDGLRPYLYRLRTVAGVSEVHRPAMEPEFTDGLHRTPKVWGAFRLDEAIGRGSYGEVWRAWDLRLDREVALKLIPSMATDDGPRVTAIVHEARLLARLRHPNVASVYGCEELTGRTGICMEYVHGRDVEEILRERGPFEPQTVCDIGLQVCDALAAVHRAGVLHRDIKASNVRRTPEGRIVLVDFGSGRDTQPATAHQAEELTGTPLYLAPELFAGAPASVLTDVYSLGVLLDHLVTGSYPVSGRNLHEIKEAHAHGNRIPVGERRPGVPRGLVRVIERATNASSTARFQTVEAMATALRSVRNMPRRLAWTATGLVVLSALLVATAGPWRREKVSAVGASARESVLITRIDNLTGDRTLDGVMESAIASELGNSALFEVLSRDSASLRNGRVKALVSGRIEKFDAQYNLVIQLIDPADGADVDTLFGVAIGSREVGVAAQRLAERLHIVLTEKRDRIRGTDPHVEPVTTASPTAFRLYNESYQLSLQGRGSAGLESLEVARKVVVADPQFGSGWIWLAWIEKLCEDFIPYTPGDGRDESYRPFAERALELVDTVSEWERHWIKGSYYDLTGDYARAVPYYEALLRLRPLNEFVADKLEQALRRLGRVDDLLAAVMHRADRRPADWGTNAYAAMLLLDRRGQFAAEPYVDRLRTIAASSPSPVSNELRNDALVWLNFFPVYAAWQRGDVQQTLALITTISESVRRRPPEQQLQVIQGIVSYYLALGRLTDARRLVQSMGDSVRDDWLRIVVAEAIDDRAELQRLVARVPQANSPEYVRAGLFDRARQRISGIGNRTIKKLALGKMMLMEGHPDAAIPYLELWSQYLSGGFTAREADLACDSLATAWTLLGNRTAAVKTLESCITNPRQFPSPDAPMGFWKLHLSAHLAQLYRQSGRVAEAETIEARFRVLLALADRDFPLLQQLGR